MKTLLARRPVQFAALMILVLLIGAGLLWQFRAPDRLALAQNRAKWASQSDASYAFDLDILCFCPFREPFHIEVRNGAATADNQIRVNTMDDVFQIVQDAIEHADSFNVVYDSTFGYPTVIGIDYIRQAVDDEVGYRIYNFQPN